MKKCILIVLGILAVNSAMSQSSIRYRIDSLKEAFRHEKTDTSKVWTLLRLRGLYYEIRKVGSSVYYAREAVHLSERINFTKGKLWSKYVLAKSYSDRDLTKSLSLLHEVIDQLKEDERYPDILRDSYFEVGMLHLYLRNFPKAIRNFQLSKSLNSGKNQPSLNAGCDLQISIAHAYLDQPDSALFYLQKAKIANPSIANRYVFAYYAGLAYVKKNPEKALSYFRKSVQLAEQSKSPFAISQSHRRLSDFLLNHTTQIDSSIRVATRGVQAAQSVQFLRGTYYNAHLLAEAYKRLNNTDSAYKYQSLMLMARDSLFGRDKVNQIQTLIVEEQQRAQRLERESQRAKLYGLLLLLVSVVVVASILYWNNHQKQKINRELQSTLYALQSTQSQLIQKEKLASLGELTAGIAHEIQNPLNFVNNYSEVNVELIEELGEELRSGDLNEAQAILADLSDNERKIHHHGRRADAIVRGMLEHARATPGEKVPTDLNALADEYLRLAYHGLRAKDSAFQCELITDFDPNLGRVAVAPSELGRVLLNLFNNAFYAVRQRAMLVADQAYTPTVWVSTTKLPLLQGEGGGGRRYGEVKISVRDNGTGMPPEVQAKIFQPFFTTKPTGEGTGLGLSLSYDIITKGHGGALRMESVPGEGTEFVVELPVITQFDNQPIP